MQLPVQKIYGDEDENAMRSWSLSQQMALQKQLLQAQIKVIAECENTKNEIRKMECQDKFRREQLAVQDAMIAYCRDSIDKVRSVVDPLQSQMEEIYGPQVHLSLDSWEDVFCHFLVKDPNMMDITVRVLNKKLHDFSAGVPVKVKKAYGALHDLVNFSERCSVLGVDPSQVTVGMYVTLVNCRLSFIKASDHPSESSSNYYDVLMSFDPGYGDGDPGLRKCDKIARNRRIQYAVRASQLLKIKLYQNQFVNSKVVWLLSLGFRSGLVDIILRCGGDIDFGWRLYWQTYLNETYLFHGENYSREDSLVRAFLEAGADPNVLVHIDLAKFCRHCLPLDDLEQRMQPFRIEGAMRPLHILARTGCSKTFDIALLLDYGADKSIRDDKGNTPADYDAKKSIERLHGR